MERVALLAVPGRDAQRLRRDTAVRERTLPSRCISRASLWHCCTKPICMNPNASPLLCRKQQCLRGHHAGSGVAQPLTASCRSLLSSLSLLESPGQAMRPKDAFPGGRGLRGLGCNGELLFTVGIEPQIPKPVGLEVESR